MLRSVWSSSEIDGLRQLLMEHWDPIGVHAFAEADDDRSSYWTSTTGTCPRSLRPHSHQSLRGGLCAVGAHCTGDGLGTGRYVGAEGVTESCCQ